MPQNEILTLMIIGGVFILLGLGALFWGKSEEKHYYDSISSRQDTREFLEGWPRRPQFTGRSRVPARQRSTGGQFQQVRQNHTK